MNERQNYPYIDRSLTASIIEATDYFPVITLTGPRQSGKSTLLRHIFPDVAYRSMEDPDLRAIVKEDPRGFLDGFHDGVIIDEVQHVPDLLSYIQGIVDADPRRRFYLTGSSQFALIKSVSQSLAGRSAVFELLPLSLREVAGLDRDMMLDDIMVSGFYPAVWCGRNIARLLYPAYTRTYIERDVRDFLAIRDLDVFRRFVKLCAARIGSVFKASELSNELGVAVNTVNSWLSVLQASYLVYMLPPFFTNARKRLTKSPKLYFTDVGLAAYLLDIESAEVMNRDKMRGHLFENLVVMEALKARCNSGRSDGLYFYRDTNGNEVDLMIKSGSAFRCIEIKSSATYHPDFLKGLKAFEKSFPELVATREIVYTGVDMAGPDGISLTNYRNF